MVIEVKIKNEKGGREGRKAGEVKRNGKKVEEEEEDEEQQEEKEELLA